MIILKLEPVKQYAIEGDDVSGHLDYRVDKEGEGLAVFTFDIHGDNLDDEFESFSYSEDNETWNTFTPGSNIGMESETLYIRAVLNIDDEKEGLERIAGIISSKQADVEISQSIVFGVIDDGIGSTFSRLCPDAIKELNKGNYVFSSAFYNGFFEDMTKLERLVYNYLNDDVLPIEDVLALTDDVRNWNELDRFYYTPVVILLLKEVTRTPEDF